MHVRRWIPALLVIAIANAGAQVGRTPKDTELEKAIREKFARSKCAADKFTVRVTDGVATIEGRTEVIQRKSAATRMAKSAGARKVINKIELSEAAKTKAGANLSTGRRRVQVKRSEPRR